MAKSSAPRYTPEMLEKLGYDISDGETGVKNKSKVKPQENVKIQAVETRVKNKPKVQPPEKTQIRAKAQLEEDGMNKTERAYSLVLTRHPDVHKWYFESVNLRVGVGKSWYRCDFFVIKADGKIEMHEVKGFWRDDALVKIRAAQLRYPAFKFIVVKKTKGGFHLSDAVSPQMTKK